MKLLRYQLKPVSSIGTPMKADTLAGQLLCLYAEKHGEEQMEKLIAEMKSGLVPFAISDAFPTGTLPCPVLPAIKRNTFEQLISNKEIISKGNNVKQKRFHLLKEFKQFKSNIQYIPLENWIIYRKNLSLFSMFKEYLKSSEGEHKKPEGWQKLRKTETHNIINRNSGRVLENGGIFTTETEWYAHGKHQAKLDLYVSVEDEKWQAELDDLLRRMGQTGFGRDASTGKGHFTLSASEDASGLLEMEESNARMTLSTCATTKPEQVSGWYNLKPKFGKVWNGFGEIKPFKKPILMFDVGSVFTKYPVEWGSGILTGVHRSAPSIIQHTTALLIPVKLSTLEVS